MTGPSAVMMKSKGTAEEVRPIERRRQTGPCPLSFAQEQFWLLDQMVPGSPAYNIVDVIAINGEYDASALKGALDELVQRYEILRTSISLIDGQLMQIVSLASDLPLPEVDLTSLPELERAREWTRIAREEGQKTFDLSQPALVRATVVHHSRHEHKVLLTIHHIAADEWAMGLIQEEMKELYAAFSRKQPSPLPVLPVQYADFACWQRDRFEGEKLEKQIAYWKAELKGASPILALPTDKPRPAAQTFRGATESFSCPKALLRDLRALGLKEQATLFMILQAAFAALLHRYSGQADILVGTPVSGRTQSETQRLVGCFLNTVVLRSQFAPGQTFRALLHQARTRTLGAFAHAELPFGRLVATVAPHRDSSRTPLFQVMFVLHDPDGDSQASKVFGPRGLENGTSKFDLTLYASTTDDGIEGLIEYSTDLFEAKTVQRLCRHFGVLLQAIARDPDQSISRLPILAEADRQQLLVEWNDTAVVFPETGLCLHQLFERQAERTPDNVAVVCGRDSLSYGELDRRSNQLARHLAGLGVGPDVLVGLLVERSPEMVVALLAILKAGGAYLPLDPDFPPDRLAHMVADSKMSVLITQGELAQTLRSHPAAVVRLDNDRDDITKHDVAAPATLGLRPDHLAYVLYTSGSTGLPKGVAIPHSAIVNFLLSMQRQPGFTASDTLLAVTTLSFDIAGLELYLPLVSGAKVVIASRTDAQDPYRLMEWLREHACTVMQATPATWRALISAGWGGSPGLRALCGGESLTPDLAKALLPRCAELWNMYGPTETTVWSTVHRITSADGQPPIGRPIANTQIYVLDADRNLVPPGAIGELYIGGDGLARGYLHRPELTRERFVPSPFKPEALLYRTGDLARWRCDGLLECLGRTDHQVKIRGYRIELGEIEAAIARHAAVRQVVVVARDDGPGEMRLVAYLVGENPPPDLVDQIRVLLRAALPEYMMPSHFVELGAFPLTPNGKIDRKALPSPLAQPTPAPSRGPRTTTEECLVGIWRNLLKRDGISTDDNFFDIGGHSLLTVALVSEAKRQMGAQLSLAQVLRSPTIAGLAESIDAILGRQPGVSSPDSDALVELKPGGPRCLFFVFDGLGEVLPYLTLARCMPPGYAAYGILPHRLPRIPLAHASIPEMARHCVDQMRRRQPHGPYTIGGLCDGGVVAFAAAEQLERNGDRVDHVIILDAVAPKTRLRPWRVSARRWERFSTALRQVWQPKTAQLPPNPLPTSASNSALSTVVQKVGNLVKYEILHVIKSVSVAVRLPLLNYVLARNRAWPQWLPSLTVPDIFWKAQVSYNAGCVSAPIVLVKAREGADSDLPSAELVTDPLLGWGDRTTGHLQIINAVGGHSSMLQEPNVALIAERLTILLDPAASDRGAPARASKSS